tara:strand:- start:3483 stop:5666 length:2184 start_codon:yes stop_codon:yes gene_type:complete
MNKVPYEVVFYAASYLSNEQLGGVGLLPYFNSETKKGENTRDVTAFVDQMSWTFSTTSPYETISLTLAFPLGAFQDVFPGHRESDAMLAQPGFWVTIRQNMLKGKKLLAWGRVDTLNVSTSADPQTGALMTLASLSASSWVNYVNDNAFFLTEANFRELFQGNEGLSQRKAISNLRLDLAAINDGEFEAFTAHFSAISRSGVTNTDSDAFYGKLISGRENLLNSSLGTGVASLWYSFAKKIPLPASFKGVKQYDLETPVVLTLPDGTRGEIVRRQDFTNFAEMIPVLYATGAAYDDFDASDDDRLGEQKDQQVLSIPTRLDDRLRESEDVSLIDLSRFGNHASVPLGQSGSFLLKEYDGGVFSWMTNTFGLDPNYVEMFPTLIEIDCHHYLDKHKEAFVETYVDSDEIIQTRKISNEDPSILVTKDGKFLSHTFTSNMNKEPNVVEYAAKNENRPSLFSKYHGNDHIIPRMMVPVIMYRMKPVFEPGRFEPGFDAEAHNDVLIAIGQKPTYPNLSDRDDVPVFTAEKFPHFKIGKSESRQKETTSKNRIVLKGDVITSLNFSVSENTRINVFSVRSPSAKATNLQFGLGYSNVRRPVFDRNSVGDYGVRRQEVSWDVIYSDPELYHAIAEYCFEIARQQVEHVRGSFSCELDPRIRAGMYVTIEVTDNTGLKGQIAGTCYVEEVSHSMSILPTGGFVADTQVSFSQARFVMPSAGSTLKVGDKVPYE